MSQRVFHVASGDVVRVGPVFSDGRIGIEFQPGPGVVLTATEATTIAGALAARAGGVNRWDGRKKGTPQERRVTPRKR
jgi:hypothetical protein